MSDYPEVDKIVNCIKKLNLRFEIDHKFQGEESWHHRLFLIHQKQKYPFIIDDEFDDIKQFKSPVLMQLILMEIEDYEDAEDYLVWCKDKGLKVNSIINSNWYFELRENVPLVKAFIGDLEPIMQFDFHINMGASQALREIE